MNAIFDRFWPKILASTRYCKREQLRHSPARNIVVSSDGREVRGEVRRIAFTACKRGVGRSESFLRRVGARIRDLLLLPLGKVCRVSGLFVCKLEAWRGYRWEYHLLECDMKVITTKTSREFLSERLIGKYHKLNGGGCLVQLNNAGDRDH